MEAMTSPWGPIIAALITGGFGLITGAFGMIRYFIERRKRQEADRLTVEATNLANKLSREHLRIERERNDLARENEFNRRVEAAQLKALSDDPKQRRVGLIDLGALRDEAPSPEREHHVQAHIDAITNAVLGNVMVNSTGIVRAFLENMPPLIPPPEPPSSSPEGLRIWELSRQTAENTEEIKSLMIKETERQQKIGQSLIDGEDPAPAEA
ncbi:hypothetical protein P5V43_05190 [Mycobacteroides abscessus subsp. bolletii]|uniref:hypothetical protein n=1 Tax=Mycobacteroides abscessus TaxID=36809 RepID=UPI00266BEBE3|nr:hypothetical protein [Mycobacteroides abscessus]MDO3126495.1 hypothetical protein [Mycobacteroides abscessus subsp. bolletii]